jgi:hypothetical protein
MRRKDELTELAKAIECGLKHGTESDPISALHVAYGWLHRAMEIYEKEGTKVSPEFTRAYQAIEQWRNLSIANPPYRLARTRRPLEEAS